MAARKRIGLAENTRQRIRASMLVKRLEDHVDGKVDLAATQVTAALGLLRKSLPDLQATTHDIDPERNVLRIVHESK